MKLILKNLDETKQLAIKLSQEAKPNKFFLLSGDLGAGKTTFTKFLLASLKVDELVSSPTFVLLKQYITNDLTINHIDAYRLTKSDNAELLIDEFDDAFNVIEWYENLDFDFNQVDYLKITFHKLANETREVEIGRKVN